MTAFAAPTLLAVRLWEFGIFGLWLAGLLVIVRLGRSPLSLGVYAGATLTIFWDWICGSSYLFDIPHYDHRFLFHLWTIQGRTEPLWVAFAQGPYFGLPAVLVLRWRWLREHGNIVVYLALGALVGVGDYALEGISVHWQHLYTYRYSSGSLVFSIPWEVLYVYVPICVACTCFLVDRVSRLLSLAGMEAITPRGDSSHGSPATWAPPPAGQAIGHVVATVATSLRDERIAFWLGVAIPIAALYPGAWVLALLNGGIHPLLPGA